MVTLRDLRDRPGFEAARDLPAVNLDAGASLPFAEALLAEHALVPDPACLAAADDVVRRLRP